MRSLSTTVYLTLTAVLAGAPASHKALAGDFEDCNTNGISDSVDIDQGTSADCNSDGIPDECGLLPECFATQTAKIYEDRIDSNARFGAQLAIDYPTLAVTAPLAEVNGQENRGSVFILEFDEPTDEWVHRQELHPPDMPGSLYFGRGLALDGDFLFTSLNVIPDTSNFDIYICVFRYSSSTDTWDFHQLLSHEEASVTFGDHIAAKDGLMVATEFWANNETPEGTVLRTGAAYIYQYDSSTELWGFQQRLVPADASPEDWFGRSAVWDDDRLIVSNIYDDDSGHNTGSVYVFEQNAVNQLWEFAQKLEAPDAIEWSQFGYSLDIDGDRLIIGADRIGEGSDEWYGGVYFFERDPVLGWIYKQHFLGEMGNGSPDFLGTDVAINGGLAIAVATNADSNGEDSGAALLYTYNETTGQWNHLVDLVDSYSSSSQWYRSSVIADEKILVGLADGYHPNYTRPGAILYFDYNQLNEPDCNCNGEADTCDVFYEVEVDCDENQQPDVCQPEDDSDGDTVLDACDICPGANDFDDMDADGVPDACDECPEDNPDDVDGDGLCNIDDPDDDNDGVEDAQDPSPFDPSICGDIDNDNCDDCSEGTDGFGILSDQDPLNDGLDSDGDGICNLGDPCPFDDPDDTDGDGVCDFNDACPGHDDNMDTDGDGAADGCDTCPLDHPNDSDADFVCDSDDICPGGPDWQDEDGDKVPDFCDPCPTSNPDDIDGDNVCDSKDICIGGDDTQDEDADGNPDFCDPCPLDNPDDPDNDGVCTVNDICPGGPDSADIDADGIPDFCDSCPLDNPDDPDGDGVCFSQDQCQGGDDNSDKDGDGTPDFCDPCPNDNPDDSDADSVCNSDDLCANADDLAPGAIDDDDNDNVLNCNDGCPENPNKIEPGFCGCDSRDPKTDSNGDGVIDENDCGQPIPTTSAWGLLALGMLLLTCQKIISRKRQPDHSILMTGD